MEEAGIIVAAAVPHGHYLHSRYLSLLGYM